MRREGVERAVLALLLRAGGDFVSGAEIANAVGVSRPTVHRVVEELRGRGYLIESHPRRGYRLVLEDDLSTANYYIKSLLTNTPIRYSVHYVEKCRSTQDIAEALAREGAEEGLVVVAEEMSGGRGRLGRRWAASRGGLWFTILLRPPTVEGLQLISLGAGVAVAEALRELHGVEVALKWPNDVLVDSRKLCGILVEGRMEADRIHYVLVGIGINVNNDIPEDLRGSAVSLKELLEALVPRVPLLAAVLVKFAGIYALLRQGECEEVLLRWKRLSSTLGKDVRVVMHDEVIEGKAIDVDVDGSLMVEVHGTLRKVYAGDVIHLR